MRLQDFLDRLSAIELYGKTFYSLSDFVENIEQLDEDIVIESNGLLIEPYFFTDRPVALFPYVFYAQKYDPKECVLHEAGEALLSSRFKELQSVAYQALDPAFSVIEKEYVYRYLNFVADRFVAKDMSGFNLDKGRNGLYFTCVSF